MNIDKYIERINFQSEIKISYDCLKELHKCHVMSIPFEAIDVQLKRRINLHAENIYQKVIANKRGGYCYELNLLFHELLSKIGFENYIISAKIFDNGNFGPEFDHMAIVVKLDRLYLVDVGFGDLFIEPLQIESELIQVDKFKKYKIKKNESNDYILTESLLESNDFRIKYKFNILPRTLNDFNQQNDWKQTSGESYFVKNRICTIPIENGRRTIFNNIYKVKDKGHIEEQKIESENKLIEILQNDFNIKIENTPYNKGGR